MPVAAPMLRSFLVATLLTAALADVVDSSPLARRLAAAGRRGKGFGGFKGKGKGKGFGKAKGKGNGANDRTPQADGSDIHLLTTSSCNYFQHWQVELVLNSAWRHKFRGPITHIIVGCEQSEAAGMRGKRRFLTHIEGDTDKVVANQLWHRSSHPNVTRYFAPFIMLAHFLQLANLRRHAEARRFKV